MVKVQGPAFSLAASGKLGGTVVFSKWKGRPYVRELVKPANPKSGGQISVRAMMKFLSQEWSGLSTANKATWATPADAKVVSNFNAYTSENLKRNRSFLAPGQAYPVTAALTADGLDTFAASPGVREVQVSMSDLDVQGDNWGFLLFRALSTGFTPSFSNLHAVVASNGASEVYFVDGPLEPDTYYYDAKAFTTDGALSALKGEINAVVT